MSGILIGLVVSLLWTVTFFIWLEVFDETHPF